MLPLHRPVARTAVCVALLAATACGPGTRPSTPTSAETTGAGEIEQGTEVAQDVVVDVAANGRRLVVRNQRSADIMVLDTALEPRREESHGTLTLTYVRPGAVEGGEDGDEPALFEAVPVEANGDASIEPPFSLRSGDRFRYCLEVVDPAERVGSADSRVHDREAGQAASVACSESYEVR